MTHTPGPWDVSKDAVPDWYTQMTVSAEDGERVATVFLSEANARLIAAAPDLLNTLRIVEAHTDREWIDATPGIEKVRVILHDAARDAIVKAEEQ